MGAGHNIDLTLPGSGNGKLFQNQLLMARAGTGCDRTDLAYEPGAKSSQHSLLEGAGEETLSMTKTLSYHKVETNTPKVSFGCFPLILRRQHR